MIRQNPKMDKKQNCYMDRNSLIVYIKTEDAYVDNGKEIEGKSSLSNY